MKLIKLDTKIVRALLNTQALNNVLTMMSESLFYCYEKVFTNMNIWIIGKNSAIVFYLNKIFTAS